MRARSVGTYSTISERPLSGEVVRDDQLAWLARALPAMVGDLAAYKHADANLRALAYRTLGALEPLVDGARAATAAPEFQPLARAMTYARAAGLELAATAAGLRVGIAPDLYDDNALPLPRPIETVYGTRWSRVPVLPAALRGEPRTLYLDAAYADVVARPSEATVAEVIEEASRLFCEALVPSSARLSDYTASAAVRIGDAVRAPLALLAELLRPVIDGLARERAELTLAEHVETALLDRVVLLASPRNAHFIATPVAIGTDDDALELPTTIANALGVTAGTPVAVHLPLSDRAQHEARQRVGADPVLDDEYETRLGWLDELADSDDKTGVLLRVVRTGELDPCRSPRAAMLVGRRR